MRWVHQALSSDATQNGIDVTVDVIDVALSLVLSYRTVSISLLLSKGFMQATEGCLCVLYRGIAKCELS